ncbi:ABC-2 type transport system ATP-binding protein [Jatrophihabitans endophyticus]|uniref:ABC-2 type transport system ATP-binding protein n=1 Tax=Jatrophihabitans endophyticus TaxID=1206085 RepID=A0A1M5RCE0_9ACTN|nr:ATP-binding cassette domain-containing protein [Jatrophihabitans endophyticus]SHH23995.1 ABC-2 type transport system ATP-binding protein [Jatrophihabitans endophyticus]
MLSIVDLHKSYGTTTALDGVSLDVRPGELVGFVGANGAGKSTTMRIAMGLVAADSGTVRWHGEPLTFTARRRFGYMPEERGLYPKMRVVEQVAYFGRLHGMSRADADRGAAALIEQMGVVAQPRDFVQALSLGNQQRVQLAAALVHDPELLVLDEPFSGLDPVGVDTMAEVLRQRRRAGCGVLFSSHQLELVERLCDRVVIVRAGRVVAQGTLDELRATGSRDALEVTVTGTDDAWLDALPGVTVRERDGATVVLALRDPDDDQAVLAAAARAGRVERFGWRRPSLAELYRDAVSAGAGTDTSEAAA